MNEDYKSWNVVRMMNALPQIIQKGKVRCNLDIKKEGNTYFIGYTNAKDDYLVSHEDIEEALKEMMEKLNNPPSKKYIIDFDWEFDKKY